MSSKLLTLPPSASCLSESMRDIGYSLETAIADLIDNSITALAKNIEIFFDVEGEEPVVIIYDDGHGMTGDNLIEAMRHGSISPKSIRSKIDLGRFGLGLKTASFSQCRSITVASKNEQQLSAAEWDLDLIDKKDEWVLKTYGNKELKNIPHIDLLSENPNESGTLVVWRKLDRIFENEVDEKKSELIGEKIDLLDKHLSLVFHRFLQGDVKNYNKLTIKINGHKLNPFDPFCKENLATQALPEEYVSIGEETIKITPYILPHHSRLTEAEYRFYQDRSDFLSNQGAYVYRNGRLMVWGDWFRLVPKGEATKLARVQIDFTNALDEEWTIDIKKSRASPPPIVRERLKQIIKQISNTSIRVHKGRGQKLYQETASPVWERYATQEGVSYAVNKSHPIVNSLYKRLDKKSQRDLNVLLSAVSTALPIEMIYSDYSTRPKEILQHTQYDDIEERLRMLKEAIFNDNSFSEETFLEVIKSIRGFDKKMDKVRFFINQEFENA